MHIAVYMAAGDPLKVSSCALPESCRERLMEAWDKAGGPSDCIWVVPATDPEDPEYEASYKRTHELRAHRNAFWLGEYPR